MMGWMANVDFCQDEWIKHMNRNDPHELRDEIRGQEDS